MPRRHLRICFALCATLAVFASCHTERAKPLERETLTIASDFLDEDDTLLFSGFVKKYNVRLIIRSMSTDGVIGLIGNAEYNSGLDLILSSSSQSAFRLSKQHIFQSISEDDSDLQIAHEYFSTKYDYVALGIDPFVISYASDSTITARTYQDLFKIPHYHTLNRDDILCFMSPLRHEKNQVETYKWIERWYNLAVERPKSGAISDSLPATLRRYSQLEDINAGVIYYPDGLRSGCYYDLSTMGIVKQAENYLTAKKFISYYSNPGHNSIINKKLQTYPLFDYLASRQNKFTLNSVKSETFLQYHGIIDRIINKLD
jgi:hypothetical protein